MHTLKKGLLIAIEGIDGSGKSTLAKNLYQSLVPQYPVLLTKEPGDTPLGQRLRSLVQEKKVPITSKAEFLLFATDRAQHFNELIIPHLEAKKIIISDRMADSSLVYQGYGRGLNMNTIKTINAWVMDGITPHLTLYVKVSAELAAFRIAQRKASLTSFEKEKQDFFQKLIAGFDDLYKNRNDVIILDGTQSEETLTHHATTALITWIQNNLTQ